jgi:hypothetical protein
MNKVDLMRSILQFGENWLALKHSSHSVAETILLKLWQKFFMRNGWRSWGGRHHSALWDFEGSPVCETHELFVRRDGGIGRFKSDNICAFERDK